MSADRRRARSYSEPFAGMTSMIDVVFLLLIFFIITLEPEDLLASLPVDRPQPDKEVPEIINEPPAFRLTVTKDGYIANGKRVDLDYVNWYLEKMNSRYGLDEALIICHDDSRHTMLIKALNTCMANNVTNLMMMSRPAGAQ